MHRIAEKVQWVRPPHQARSQESMERILDAAEEVIREKGFDSATVSEIVRKARSSVGTFYARFRDKDALLNLLHERFYEEAIATTDAALDLNRWENASVGEIIGELVPFLVRIYRERGGLIRALIVRGVDDTALAMRSAQVFEHVAMRLRALLLARRHEITHPDPDLAIEFGYRLVTCMLDMGALCSNIPTFSGSLSTREVSQQLVRAFLSYLGIDASEASLAVDDA